VVAGMDALVRVAVCPADHKEIGEHLIDRFVIAVNKRPKDGLGHSIAVGVKVALEVMGNSLSTPADLIEMLERSFEGTDLGICMDVGHAHMLGDVADAIETASEYLATTHIHDNRGKSDDHLVPFQGTINWAAAIMAFEKIGYDGVLMYEVRAAEGTGAVLNRAVAARKRLEALMSENSQLSAFSSQDTDG